MPAEAAGRVFQAIARIIEASPALAGDAKITSDKITFRTTGGTITAIASDFAGAAGANPTITVFDELWGVTTERGHRLWDEMVPPPTRQIACRLTTTYAGFEGESQLLEQLYNRGHGGGGDCTRPMAPARDVDVLDEPLHGPLADPEWAEQMRQQLRPSAYLRLIENRWVSSELSFIDMEWWDACVAPAARPVLRDPRLPVWVGVDASVKRNSTAIVVCTADADQRVRVVCHYIFQPSPEEPLDFEVYGRADVARPGGAVRDPGGTV